jgi:hypothetical protein
LYVPNDYPNQLAGLGIAGQEVLVHGLEDDVLRPDIEVGQPALVAERRHRDGERAFGLRGFRRRHGADQERDDRDDECESLPHNPSSVRAMSLPRP